VTYGLFHVLFTLPLLVLLTFWAAPWGWGAPKWLALSAVLAVVMVFTSVWDNYAVARRIWDFAPGRFWRRILWLPVEEYAFFWIQSLQVIFFVDGMLQRWPGVESSAQSLQAALPWCGGLLLGWAGVGLLFHRRWGDGTRGHYAWHLLFWFVPILALQWIIGWGILGPRAGFLLAPTLLIGTWLVYADVRAVQHGIWFFDEKQITGHKLLRILPWEEIAFFYLTSLLVAQTWLLLLPEALR
jgi:lycopene cyclase domain-containing protein